MLRRSYALLRPPPASCLLSAAALPRRLVQQRCGSGGRHCAVAERDRVATAAGRHPSRRSTLAGGRRARRRPHAARALQQPQRLPSSTEGRQAECREQKGRVSVAQPSPPPAYRCLCPSHCCSLLLLHCSSSVLQQLRDRLKRCSVSVLLCAGGVDAELQSVCSSLSIAVLSAVPRPALDAVSRLSGAAAVPELSRLDSRHLGRAAISLTHHSSSSHRSGQRSHSAAEGGQHATPHLLLSSPRSATDSCGALSVSVLSAQPSPALSRAFSSHFWRCLNRIRNARRDGWRVWKGGGETELEWLRCSLAAAQEPQRDGDGSGGGRQAVAEAFAAVLRSVLTRSMLNAGCDQQQAERSIQTSAALTAAAGRRPSQQPPLPPACPPLPQPAALLRCPAAVCGSEALR